MSEMGLAMMGSGIGRGDDRATEAAEMAISSPLLEDIDLAGARGILVNITAGLDMAIGEFEEVGNVVRQFAADDATVVVGTAIDEGLEGELRVTVVATGLGQEQKAQLRTVQQAVQSRVAAAGGAQYGAQQYGGGSAAGAGGPAQAAPSPYGNYEKPTVIRKTARGNSQGVSQGSGHAGQGKSAGNSGHDVEYLDIPAFLRRQAD